MNEKKECAFRLYVAGESPNSMRAVENLKAFCAEILPGNHRIEIVDVLEHGGRAMEDGVLLTPMLVILSSRPELRIIGSLSRRESLVQMLQLGDSLKGLD